MARRQLTLVGRSRTSARPSVRGHDCLRRPGWSARIPIIDPLYVLSGLFVGLIVGLTGVGGGSLMTPLLVILFGIHPTTAVGSDLLYAAITKSVGTIVHGVRRNVDWRIAVLLAAGSLPATVLTIIGLKWFGIGSAGAAKLVSTLLGVALLATSLAILLRHRIAAYAARRATGALRHTAALTIATGVALGFFVSISSVGAGALGVTALILLYPNLPTARIVGTDIAHAVPLTLVAGLGHWAIGSVDWHLIGALLIGSIPGIVLGSLLAPRVPEQALRTILAAVLVVVGVKLLV